MSLIDAAIEATQGPISGVPSYDAGNDLGTSATAVRPADTDQNAHRRLINVRILNPNSSARLAYGFASTIKADVSNAACADVILPEREALFSYTGDLTLYIVADGASSEYQVSYRQVR